MKEGGRKEVESSIGNKDEHHRVRKKLSFKLMFKNNLYFHLQCTVEAGLPIAIDHHAFYH